MNAHKKMVDAINNGDLVVDRKNMTIEKADKTETSDVDKKQDK